MNKLILAAVAVGLATLSATGPSLALGKIANPEVKLDVVNGPKTAATTDTTSPGEAFYPDTTAVGDPKAECIAQGGRPVRVAEEYDFSWRCAL